MRISDWSSDVCSYDLQVEHVCINKWGPQPPPYLVQSSCLLTTRPRFLRISQKPTNLLLSSRNEFIIFRPKGNRTWQPDLDWTLAPTALAGVCLMGTRRSEEHTSELQSLMRISYAVFCLKKKNNDTNQKTTHIKTP